MGMRSVGSTVAKQAKQEKQRPGFIVRLPDEFKGPLEARAESTGRTIVAELSIAIVKHLMAAPEASALMRLPADLPTGHAPTQPD